MSAESPQDVPVNSAGPTDLDTNIRNLARALAPQGGDSAVVVKGVVTAVDAITFAAVPHTVTVTLNGDTSSPVAGVRFLNSYSPLVGDTVLMLKQGGELFIIGQMSVALPSASGWTQPTLGTGFTHNGVDPIQYRVIYDHGSPKVQLRGGATQSGTNTTIFTMPAGYRPLSTKTPILIARDFAGGSNAVQMVVNTNGTMVLQGTTTGVADVNGTTGTSSIGVTVNSTPFNTSGDDGEHQHFKTYAPDNNFTDFNGPHQHTVGAHGHGMAHTHPVTVTAVTHPTSLSLNGIEYFL